MWNIFFFQQKFSKIFEEFSCDVWRLRGRHRFEYLLELYLLTFEHKTDFFEANKRELLFFKENIKKEPLNGYFEELKVFKSIVKSRDC